ncbi:tRNA (adenosine(37)-N6)-dimethylallyltransferase MiaA [Phycisphaera mikurensis]|uniref:tRNA dimethylallyltransferase n=1 Tax=Phycisphaera mikurensis (strain NBRC 102666 / KCTC 22515 / FYK2301M01) TaxID=1142394 RepID=I0IFJ0_PHYMF|nr:tRNA (adenosine(37)-N6)-dimethylallyltransferase MiaA [Phycisphaera mikurensis]MBB6440580.1 tRNA dimethylallyltransferase [Phycisphaera mikurensis]BAM04028.1 tRNA dimethylallyltransferase [Phycisphaera mikurensis NBRC 102666]
MPPVRPIVLLGPTAGGKSALAVELAERLGGEVVSADAFQVYRHLDAGTAKPTAKERARVPHHLVDVVEPTQRFTVRDWLNRADAEVQRLVPAGRVPIVVGGTNLYVRALLEGLMEGPDADPAFRASLAAVPDAELHARLREVDPAAADRIAPADRQRTVRGLEVFHLTGRPLSGHQREWSAAVEPPYRHDPVLLALRWEVPAINRRINARVKAMFERGLVEETRRLEAAGLLGPQAREAIGTKQVLAELAKPKPDLDAAQEQVKIKTRRFAKQQRTWLRRFAGVRWLAGDQEPEALLAGALAAASG